jgi:CRP/FNR family transcriptional regulator
MTPGEASEDETLGRCAACIVRSKGLCNALICEELKRFRTIATRRTFAPGQHIHLADEKPEFFGAVISGVVKLTKILFDGRQQVVGLLLPPDSIGRVFGRKTPYFAEAATQVELCCFPYAGFERMLEDFPGLKQRLLEQTLDELDSALDWMVLLGRKTAEERVASLLLMLAMRSTLPGEGDDAGAPRAQTLDLHLKREEIADFLGLTYETVCRQISLMKKRGLIELTGRRRVLVPDVSVLVQAAG